MQDSVHSWQPLARGGRDTGSEAGGTHLVDNLGCAASPAEPTKSCVLGFPLVDGDLQQFHAVSSDVRVAWQQLGRRSWQGTLAVDGSTNVSSTLTCCAETCWPGTEVTGACRVHPEIRCQAWLAQLDCSGRYMARPLPIRLLKMLRCVRNSLQLASCFMALLWTQRQPWERTSTW